MLGDLDIENRQMKGEILLAAGANPDLQDSDESTPLLHAFYGNDLDMAELLIPRSDLSLSSYEGLTPVQFVLQNSDEPHAPNSFMRLIEAGADVNARTEMEGQTPMELAIDWPTHQGTFYLEALIEAGCDLNAKTKGGETMVHVVAGISETSIAAEMMEKLIIAGLDVDSISPYERTPLMNSIKAFNPLVSRLLLQVNCSCKLKMFSNDSQVASFMCNATYEDCQDCATFLFGDCLSSPEDQDLQKYYYNLSLTPRALEDGESIGLSPPPTSLYRLCRLALRASLPKGLAFLPAVQKLELPHHVRDFVSLMSDETCHNLSVP